MKTFRYVVLITGCSSGLGRALAIEFAKRGHTVFATARKIQDIQDLANEEIIIQPLDVANALSISSVIKTIQERTGRIDMLINNAGFGLMGPLAEIPITEIQRQFDTNVMGPLALIQAVFPYMVKQGGGHIVNVGSVSGILTTPFAGAYSASKAALHSLSDAIRMEMEPFGIKVITLQPGKIPSNFGNTAIKILRMTMPSNSIYFRIFNYIEKRAQASQSDATEATRYAERIVHTVIRNKPPALFRFGKNSWSMPFLKWVFPIKVTDLILCRMFGLHLLRKHFKSKN